MTRKRHSGGIGRLLGGLAIIVLAATGCATNDYVPEDPDRFDIIPVNKNNYGMEVIVADTIRGEVRYHVEYLPTDYGGMRDLDAEGGYDGDAGYEGGGGQAQEAEG